MDNHKRKELERTYRPKNSKKKSRGRKLRNALRIFIMILTAGIIVLSVCVIGKYVIGSGLFSEKDQVKKAAKAEVSKNASTVEKSNGPSQEAVKDTVKKPPAVENLYPTLSGKTIIIDPGHGGTDSGTIGPKTGVYESKLNMQVSSRLKESLEKAGVKVSMTRENTGTIEEPTDQGLTWAQRGRAIRNSKADLLLSIHHNYNENSKAIYGVQILYRHNNAEKLVSIMQSKFNQELAVKMDELKAEYRVLDYGSQPGIIVECGFLSNREEEKRVQTADYQNKLVSIIMESLVEYFQNNPGR